MQADAGRSVMRDRKRRAKQAGTVSTHLRTRADNECAVDIQQCTSRRTFSVVWLTCLALQLSLVVLVASFVSSRGGGGGSCGVVGGARRRSQLFHALAPSLLLDRRRRDAARHTRNEQRR